jgi:large subunit ribosomal protein L21
MIAIIETGGKQYLVSKGDIIQIEKIEGEKDAAVTFDKVLFSSDGKTHTVGKPYISGSTVEAKITKQARSKKVVILKYKAKSKYRRKQGHRQNYTEIEITKV